jgi:hypothetical protein
MKKLHVVFSGNWVWVEYITNKKEVETEDHVITSSKEFSYCGRVVAVGSEVSQYCPGEIVWFYTDISLDANIGATYVIERSHIMARIS